MVLIWLANIRLGWLLLIVANTLASQDMVKNTAVKSFIMHALDVIIALMATSLSSLERLLLYSQILD
jgi:hypothetical protein